MKISAQQKIIWAASAAVMLAAAVFSGPVKTVLAAQVSGSDDRVGSTRVRAAGEMEFSGVVESFDGAQMVVSGKTIDLSGAEMKAALRVGDAVKVHLFARPDGSLAAREVDLADRVGGGQDDGSTHDLNDDHGGTGTVVDDRGGHGTDDGALHDANDDQGGGSHGTDDSVLHDANDDSGGSHGTDDGASHDANDDHSGGGHGTDDGGGHGHGG